MKAQIVSFHCVLKNKMGMVLGFTFNQNVITQSVKRDAPLKGLAEGLQGLRKGERRHISLTAEQAYGLYDQRLVLDIPRSKLVSKKALNIGTEIMMFEESRSPKPYRIIALSKDSVTLDGNHPLAGQDLEFEIEATAAREATADELLDTGSCPSAAWLN